jgi:hypothetical protein
MSQKKTKALRKLAFGQAVPGGRRSAPGSNAPITNKTICRRIKRFYNSLGDDLRSKFNRVEVARMMDKKSPS